MSSCVVVCCVDECVMLVRSQSLFSVLCSALPSCASMAGIRLIECSLFIDVI